MIDNIQIDNIQNSPYGQYTVNILGSKQCTKWIVCSVHSVKANPTSSVEKLYHRESSKDAHTVLRSAAPKNSVSIIGTSWADSFFSLPGGFVTVA